MTDFEKKWKEGLTAESIGIVCKCYDDATKLLYEAVEKILLPIPLSGVGFPFLHRAQLLEQSAKILSAQIKQLAAEASAWAECKADEEATK